MNVESGVWSRKPHVPRKQRLDHYSNLKRKPHPPRKQRLDHYSNLKPKNHNDSRLLELQPMTQAQTSPANDPTQAQKLKLIVIHEPDVPRQRDHITLSLPYFLLLCIHRPPKPDVPRQPGRTTKSLLYLTRII